MLLKTSDDDGWYTHDSTQITNGEFKLMGNINEPQMASVEIGDGDWKGSLFLDNESYLVTTSEEEGSLEIEGGELNTELQQVENYRQDEKDSIVTIIRKIRSDKTLSKDEKDEALKPHFAFYEELYLDSEKNMGNYIGEHNASYLSPYIVRRHLYYSWEADQLDSVMMVFDPSVRDSKYAKQIAERADKVRNVSIGKVAPDFSQTSPEGANLALSDLKGKYVLIDFWASWCGPCRRENPNVVKTYEKFKGQNFEILGVSLDNDRDKWLKAIEDDKLTWKQVSDLGGWGNEVAQLYAVNSIPHTVLVDPDGIILEKNLRGDALKTKLEEIL